MTTRFNARPSSRFNVPPLRSGYEDGPAGDLTIPSVGVKDVDEAVFGLFEKDISIQVRTTNGLVKVPVMFMAGEKWAMVKNGRGVRDKNQTLVLPLITIGRTLIQQLADEDITGRGINQQTGEIVIRRRLDKSDRAYQGLINRALLKNQSNLAVRPEDALTDQLATLRPIGNESDDLVVNAGGLMIPDRVNNVYETIVVPSPQFCTLVYDVILWTQYMEQMTHVIEQLVSSFLPQGNAWRIDTPQGYWFVGTVDGNLYSSENNFDDMSREERIIKMKFTLKVPMYVFASSAPGVPVPVKRYISAPSVSFDVGVSGSETTDTNVVDDPFLGADDPTLPLANGQSRRRDQRDAGDTRLYPNPSVVSQDDPALASFPRGTSPAKYKRVVGIGPNGKKVTTYVRVLSRNRSTGETVFSSQMDLGKLDIVVIDD